MALTEIEGKITAAVERLSESVVTIRSVKFNRGMPLRSAPVQGAGTGFIIDSNGHIISNYHVVDDAGRVEVTLKDGRTFMGMVVGGDRATDVALVKIEGTHLPAARLGDSEKLKAGQMALAIGNALNLPGAPTVSLGVISAMGRPILGSDFIFEGMLQTDAAINPGNSGGPLSDLDGNVVGVNTAIIPFAQGVGFAIPINTVKWVVEQLLGRGRVVRPMLGVSAVGINKALAKRFNTGTEEGALVGGVYPDSPAYNAKMQEGDVITGIGPYEVGSIRDLLVALSKLPINQGIRIKFLRERKRCEVVVKLIESQANRK